MKLPRNVGRRHNDRVRKLFPVFLRICLKIFLVKPLFVNAAFELLRIESFAKFHDFAFIYNNLFRNIIYFLQRIVNCFVASIRYIAVNFM